MKNHICELEKCGPTDKLWSAYYHMIDVMKKFVAAERMGDWVSHLEAVREMLPYFHASGHHICAKSAHLYLQDAEQRSVLIKSIGMDLWTCE